MNGNTARMAERYAAYSELRDQGSAPRDAAGQAGLSAATQERYERSYRKAHPELPPRRNWFQARAPGPEFPTARRARHPGG
jgi:hypothetical protein